MTRLQAAYPDTFSGLVDSESAKAAFKKGQLISPLGIEGLHQIGNSVANLRRFHALGVRYATLTQLVFLSLSFPNFACFLSYIESTQDIYYNRCSLTLDF